MPSTLSRRRLIALAGGAVPLLAQGIATRGIKPAPRGKPSGLPFPVHLVDVAAEAGLRPADAAKARARLAQLKEKTQEYEERVFSNSTPVQR